MPIKMNAPPERAMVFLIIVTMRLFVQMIIVFTIIQLSFPSDNNIIYFGLHRIIFQH